MFGNRLITIQHTLRFHLIPRKLCPIKGCYEIAFLRTSHKMAHGLEIICQADVTIKFQVRKLLAFLEKNKTSIDVFGNFLAPSLAFLYISSPTYSLLLHEIVAS